MIDFQSATIPTEVMNKVRFEVPQIHANVRNKLAKIIKEYSISKVKASPPIIPLIGQAGSGKTFLLSHLYAKTIERNGFFIISELSSLIDEDNYLRLNESVINCLLNDDENKLPQILRLLFNILSMTNFNHPPSLTMLYDWINGSPISKYIGAVTKVLTNLESIFPNEISKYKDIIRALFLLVLDDIDSKYAANNWFQSLQIDEDISKQFHLGQNTMAPKDLYMGLNWLMSLNNGFSLVAIDQLDALMVNYVRGDSLNPLEQLPEIGYFGKNAEKINNFLLSLRTNSQKTLIVIAALSDAWESLNHYLKIPPEKLYDKIITLEPIKDKDIVERIVSVRIKTAYQEKGFVPPYENYPFPPIFFSSMEGAFPRTILRECARHISNCISSNKAIEWTSNDAIDIIDPQISERYDQLLLDENIDKYKAEENESLWQDLLIYLAQCLKHEESNLPQNVEIVFKRDPGSKLKNPIAHVIMQYLVNDVTRRTLSLWVILHKDSRAFTSRLKKAVVSSGISEGDKTKRLAIIRFTLPPKGKVTLENISDFMQKGGTTICPTNKDLAALKAIFTIGSEFPQTWPSWAKSTHPTNRLSFLIKQLAWFKGKDH
ncbi:MAG: ATP-binding protein [Deltaproteobacteria bacterium]|nr:ATP-binding protein [Deltaproteobacteria bacterium]